MREHKYYNAFNQIPQIGPVRFKKLTRHFPSLEQAWQAPEKEFKAAGIEESVAEIICLNRPRIDPDSEMEKLEREGVQLLIAEDESYPRLLKEISHPPAMLYLRGDPEALKHEFPIAVVGTRKISPYGKQVAPALVGELAAAGICIVSGLALGVDEIAHRSTIEKHGRTIAVLGCGIDDRSIYPSANRRVAQSIIENGGAIVSELPLYSLPLKMHFPQRNRIIAGIALGTIVVEADLQSGALITARLALDYNRQVFAVPGSIFNKVSAGPNNLLKMGAKAVTLAADVLEELRLSDIVSVTAARAIVADTPAEAKLLPLLTKEPIHINQLIKESGLPVAEVTATLTMMEMKGKAKNLGAMQYVLGR